MTHPRRRYTFRPNYEGRTRDVPFRTNSYGWRGREPTAAHSALRIAVVGDSIVFGPGVAERDTLARQLEIALAASVPTEAYALAVPSYNPSSELDLLRGAFPVLQPDLVILVFTAVNDATPVGQPGFWHSGPLVRFGKDLLRRLYAYDWLSRRFQQLRWRAMASAQGEQGTQMVGLERLYQADQPGWVDARAAIREMRSLCETHSVPFLVAVFVSNKNLGADLEEDPASEVVARIQAGLKGEGVQHMALLDNAFRSYVGQERQLWISSTDTHFSPLANRLAARYLAEQLLANRLLVFCTEGDASGHGEVPSS